MNWVEHFLAPVEITDEALGLDAIEEVGPGGLFLKHKHTRRHARERFSGRVFDRRPYQDWAAGGPAGGGADATEVAAGGVDGILAGHRPEPLPADVAAAVRAVIDGAERAAEGELIRLSDAAPVALHLHAGLRREQSARETMPTVRANERSG